MNKDSFEYLCENPTKHNLLMASSIDAIRWLTLNDDPTWYIIMKKGIWGIAFKVACELGNVELLKKCIKHPNSLDRITKIKCFNNVVKSQYMDCIHVLTEFCPEITSVPPTVSDFKNKEFYLWYRKTYPQMRIRKHGLYSTRDIDFVKSELPDFAGMSSECINKYGYDLKYISDEDFVGLYCVSKFRLDLLVHSIENMGFKYKSYLKDIARDSDFDVFKYIFEKTEKPPSLISYVSSLEKAKLTGRKPNKQTFANACRSGDLEFIKWCMNNGVTDLSGGFSICCSRGKIDLVRYLLEYVTPVQKNFSTACHYGHLDVAMEVYSDNFEITKFPTNYHYINEWLLSINPELRVKLKKRIISPNVYYNHGFYFIHGVFYGDNVDEEKYYRDIRHFAKSRSKSANQ